MPAGDGDRAGLARCSSRTFNLAAAVSGLVLCVWLMAFGWDRPATVSHDFRIEVVTDPARIPAAALGRQVWLSELVIDGVPATDAAVARQGGWRTEAPGSQWQYVCEGASSPTSISFRAANFSLQVLHHAWSGALDVHCDGVHCATLTLTSASTFTAFIRFGWEVDVGRLLFLVAGVLLALAIVRPWQGGGRLTAWLALSLAAVHALNWTARPVALTTDSVPYIEAVELFLTGELSYFPIGYGLFIDVCGLLPGNRGLGVALAQHALIVAFAVALHRRFRWWAGEAWSFLGALLGGLAYPTLFGAQAVMSDSLTYCLLAASLLLAVHDRGRCSLPRATAVGLVTGLATITRVIPVLVLVPIIAVMAVAPWSQRSWRWLLVVGCSAGVVIGSVVLNTGLRKGQWGLSIGTGRHLYNHFVYQQKLLDRTGTSTIELLRQLGGRDPRDLAHWDVAITREEVTAREALFMPVALEAARTVSVWQHLAFNAGLTWANLSKDAVPWMAHDDYSGGNRRDLAHAALLEDSRLGASHLDRSARWNIVAWPVLVWLFVASFAATWLLRTGRVEWLSWIGLVWGYMFVSSAVEYELPRYHVGVAPIVAMLGVVSVGVAWNCLPFARKLPSDGA